MNQMPDNQPSQAPASITQPAPPGTSARRIIPTSAQVQDVIPIPLLAAIFFLVLVLLWYLMFPTWMPDWKRYQARRAQRDGNYAAAIAPLQYLINLKPQAGNTSPLADPSKNPTFLGELAHAYFQTGDYENALKFYGQAQENRDNQAADEQGNRPAAPDFHAGIGQVYLAKGDLDEAEKAFQAALRVNKLDHVSNFGMGEIEMKRGNYIRAANYYKVVAREPGYEDKVQARYEELEKKLFASVDEPTTGTATAVAP
jgi:tetratricopeptide (TPR) repeat protein